jgi:hypothetical protein
MLGFSRPVGRVPLSVIIACLLALPACDQQPPTPGDTGGGQKDRGSQPLGTQKKPVQPRSLEIPESGIDLGWGWNSVEEVSVPTVCVEFVLAEELGQTKHMMMKEVSDSYEVMEAMGMTASASVKTIGYSASGKASFAKETKVTGFQSTYVMEASVDNGVRYAAPAAADGRPGIARYNEQGKKIAPDVGEIRLTAEALALARGRDLGPFFDRCGDSFVSAIYGGARLTSVISIEAKTHREQERISAELSGSGWGVHVEGGFKGEKGSALEGRKVTMKFFQTGGKGDSIPTKKEDLPQKLEQLAHLADSAPKSFRMTLVPYTALANWPERSIEIDVNELDQLASFWGAYDSLYGEMQVALENACLFEVYDPVSAKFIDLGSSHVTTLEALQDQVHETLEALREQAVECTKPDAKCTFDENQLLDPYAYRIRLPVPKPNVALKGSEPGCEAKARSDQANSVELLIDYHVRDPAKRRCGISPINEGCLKNAEIAGWQRRVGKEVMKIADPRVAQILLVEHPKLIDPKTKGEVWYEPVERTPFVWYDRRGKEVLEALVAELSARLK